MSNMTYSLVYHFVPGSEERKHFLKTAEDVAKMYKTGIILSEKNDVTLAGAVANEVAPMLVATGLSPYDEWPQDIVTCDIDTPLPLKAVGMEDGWEIFLGDNIFVGFVTSPDEAVAILERAGELYTTQEKFETLPKFVERIGMDAFRKEVLGGDEPPKPGTTQIPAEYLAENDFYDLAYSTQPTYDPPPAPTLHYGDFVRPDDNLMQILTVYPEMGPFFMEYGMHCIGCFASYEETLWEACQVHGLDIFEMLGEMNEYLSDKLGKALFTGETPLRDMFTLYPQTLEVLQEYGIELPDDMEVTLAALAAEQDMSLPDLIEQLHRKLRNE